MTNLTALQKSYKGKWVALTENFGSVIASSKSANTAYKVALSKGHKKPTLFKVPERILPYVGTLKQ